jgi:hypothetical protein
MLTRWKDSYVTKYDSPFTAFLASMDPDESGGSVEAPNGWFARFGKNIVQEDSQGFVNRTRHASLDTAKVVFGQFEDAYAEWDREEPGTGLFD